MMRKALLPVLVLILSFSFAGKSRQEHDYLSLARELADTVERTARDPETGLYGSLVDTEQGRPHQVSTTHHAGWYLPGLWMLYWQTGDKEYLEWIERHSDALWKRSADPDTGMPWMSMNLEKSAPEGSKVSHRIQYQAAAFQNWPAYMRSLRSGRRYQVVSDMAGNTIILNGLDKDRRERPVFAHAPDYFGCLDLRIPYALGVIDQDPEQWDIISADFKAHEFPARHTTGLWTGIMIVPPFGNFLSTYTWTGTIADDTYTGLILHDLTGRDELLQMTEKHTRLSIKHCYDQEGHYFYRQVNTLTGTVVDAGPRWHTNWEWALTLFILHEMTGDPLYLDTAQDNYQFLMANIDHPGHYAEREGNDWNVPQLALLCLFRYHQTGNERYLKDARRVADYLIEHRLRRENGNLYIGEDRYMDLRETGDFIAMLVCLSDPSLPVMSSRYFLYPVGIRSPVFPVFRDAYVSRFYIREDGVIEARVKGGSGSEDIYVMDLSGRIEKVMVNSKPVEWKAKKVAGHRYVIIPGVELGDVKIEILSN
ncbi:MAG: AGE family epimerase/isomerase [bacterium]